MAQQITTLTPIDPFPSRVLPQDRFDQAVRTNMDQLSGMISELNSSFIPSVNTISTQVEANKNTASQKATEASNSANTANQKATEASNSASTASQKAAQAGTSATNAENSATAAATTVSAIMVNSGDDGAASHNCFYRGKNLTNVYTLTQLASKLNSGDFSDLYIGDYWTLPVVIDGTSKNFNFRIAHFNYWKYMGDTSFTKNHIVFVPDTAFKNMKMQESNTTEGGVPATLVWTALQGELYTAVNAATCMNGHVQTHRDWIPDSVNTSAMSAAGANFQGSTVYTNTMWRDVKLGLMKENMVYGSTVFSSSGYDVGCGKSQFALFKIDPTWITGRASRFHWWLGCVTSSTDFAGSGSHGFATSYWASSSHGVRPYLLFS